MQTALFVLVIFATPPPIACSILSIFTADFWSTAWNEFKIRTFSPGRFKVKIHPLKCKNGMHLNYVHVKILELDGVWHDAEACGDCADGCECTFVPSALNDFGEHYMDYAVYLEANGCDLNEVVRFDWWERLKYPRVAEFAIEYARRGIVMLPTTRTSNVKLELLGYAFDNFIFYEKVAFTGDKVWWYGRFQSYAFHVKNDTVATFVSSFDDEYDV